MPRRFNINKTILSVCITALLVLWLFKVIEIQDVTRLFSAISPAWLLIGLACYVSAYVMRTLRFQVLLSKQTRFQDIFLITSIHNLAVRILPNPLGEFVFIRQTKEKGIAYAEGTAAVIMARVLDFLALAIICGISLLLVSFDQFQKGALFIAITLTMALAGFAFIYVMASKKRNVLRWIILKFKKDTDKSSLTRKIESLEEAFSGISDYRVYAPASLFSFAVWISMFASYYFFFLALDIAIMPLAVATAGGVQVVANSIPNIAGLGVMEAGWALGFSILGIMNPTLLAGAFGIDLLTLIGTIALGLISLFVKYTPRLCRAYLIWKQ